MTNRTLVFMLAASALLSACNDDAATSQNVPVNDNNGGLSVSSALTPSEVDLMARADFQDRTALPAFTNRADNLMPRLDAAFSNLGDLSAAIASVDDSCAVGVMDVPNSTYNGEWTCDSVQGKAHINASNVEVHLSVQGESSSADINHVYLLSGNGAYNISRAADDRFSFNGITYDVDGKSDMTFGVLAVDEVIDVIVSGTLNVSKDSNPAEVVTITSDGVGYVVNSTDGTSGFCDGSITYSTASGLQTKLVLPACQLAVNP